MINISEVNKKKEILLLIVLVQLFINVFLTSGHIFQDSIKFFHLNGIVIFALNFFITIIAIFLFVEIIKLTKKEQELIALKAQEQYRESLSAFLREIRHDFNNEIFVIKGLLQLGQVQKALDYANDINLQFNWMQALLDAGQTEFASFILSKVNQAKNLGITVEINITSQEFKKIPGDIFIRTVGNLLDNAIYALQENQSEHKRLTLEITSQHDQLVVRVGNTGKIPEEISARMFERGFTTKGEKEGHGLGLHIVCSLMEGIGGKVSHETKEDMTFFNLNFPQ